MQKKTKAVRQAYDPSKLKIADFISVLETDAIVCLIAILYKTTGFYYLRSSTKIVTQMSKGVHRSPTRAQKSFQKLCTNLSLSWQFQLIVIEEKTQQWEKRRKSICPNKLDDFVPKMKIAGMAK